MCKIITCGFPFASEMALAFPSILGKGDSHALKKSAELLGVTDFIRYLEGTRKLRGNGKLIYAFGYKSESAWWQYFNTTVQCVAKLTGCDLGDIGCADRHAFQRLIRGPFKGISPHPNQMALLTRPNHQALLTRPFNRCCWLTLLTIAINTRYRTLSISTICTLISHGDPCTYVVVVLVVCCCSHWLLWCSQPHSHPLKRNEYTGYQTTSNTPS